MCGIAGFFSANPLEEVDHQHLAQMAEVMEHRGPDGHGYHFDPKGGLGMAHTRLTIIDLHTGTQPLFGKDRSHILTANGEFYDFKRIRSMAMADAERFTTKTDSEIALSLYEKYGLDFMEHLRGEFAFALYDRKNDQLILGRDRFGIRPLFYHVKNNKIYWASEVKSLLKHPDVPAELCPQSALNQMMQVMVPGTSAFKGVESLQPGHLLVIKRRNGSLDIQTHRYWDIEFPEAGAYEDAQDEASCVMEVREKLVESILFRLEADVPVGCYLSGGIDSCCILGLATGAMQSPVKAFTISFDHDDYDESTIAAEMARSMNADQEVIKLKAEDLYGDNFVNTVWHAERTFYNTLGVAKYLMSKRVRECGYKTVITGEGSDELFGGYPAFKRDMFLHGMQHESDANKRALQEALENSNKLFKGAILAEESIAHPAFDALCGFTPSWIQPWIATLAVARPLMHDDVLEGLRDYDPIAAIADTIRPDAVRGRHPLDIAQYTWSKVQLEGQILNWGGDRVDMANSMESRPAFLDHHVAEAAIKIPPSMRIKGNIEKWVLREAVKGVLPEVLYKREKFAFMAPPAHTDDAKKAKLDELLDAFVSEEAVADAGLFSVARVKQFIDDYKKDTDPVSLTRKDTVVNHLLCLQIMHHKFVKAA